MQKELDEVLSHWNNLWTRDAYYAVHDIPADSDGISQLLIKALKGSCEGETLLDVGSGPGTRTIPFVQQTKLRLTLVDKLESAHVLAEKRAGRYGICCNRVQADALALPFEENSFDYVVSIGLVEHFFDGNRKQAFSELYRVTKQGGRTIVLVPNGFGTIKVEQIIKEATGCWAYGPSKLLGCGELKGRMESYDFKKVEAYGVSVLTSFVRLLPQNMQRNIFRNRPLWYRLANLPGNFNISSPLNRYFGEEIMAVGYK